VHNKQKQVLRLQRAVLGVLVRLVGLLRRKPELQGCESVRLHGCLQDGSFTFVIELWCSDAWRAEAFARRQAAMSRRAMSVFRRRLRRAGS